MNSAAPIVRSYQLQHRCKMCMHSLREQLDSMLLQGKPYPEIISFAAYHEFKITKKNCSIHYRMHLKPSLPDALANLPPCQEPLPPALFVPEPKDKEAIQKAIQSNAEFCDRIIEDVDTRIKSGALKPSITEALKAVELKIKINEGNPFENVFLDFLMNISSMPTDEKPAPVPVEAIITTPGEEPPANAK